MLNYNCSIRFTTPYLQARYSDEAKEELDSQTGQGIQPLPEESWKSLLYSDKQGIYIPATHFQKCLEAAGKTTKWKKTKSNWLKWVQAYLSVLPFKIYLNKEKPDDLLPSNPKRKDGSRVKIIHPLFNEGLQVEFQLENSSPDVIKDGEIQGLLALAGKMFGIGGRRADKFGRFEVVSFERKI